MNPREKILAMIIGGLVLMAGVYLVGSRVADSVGLRTTQITALNQELDRQERTLTLASRASRKLKELQTRSLPSNRERANAVYNEWLLALVDEVEFRDPSVKAADRRVRAEFFDRLRFVVEGEATLEQLTSFLTAFYETSDLHRIDDMTVEPIRDSRHLDIMISIEAMSLPKSQRETVGDAPSSEVTETMIVTSQQAIQNRALFFPLNIAPQFSAIADQRIERGRRWRIEARASDPDPWDTVEFELKSEAPTGLRFSDERGRAVLSWTPRELGEHTIQLAARDTGSPSRETVREFKITVVEPPERARDPERERPRVVGFDHASQTYLVGTVGRGTDMEAWFNVRTQGKILKLANGDRIRIGSVSGTIDNIGPKWVKLETDSGVINIAIGQRLTDAYAALASKEVADR